jgi:hypothetical protein
VAKFNELLWLTAIILGDPYTGLGFINVVDVALVLELLVATLGPVPIYA